MSAKVGFTNAGHLGHTRNVDQAQHQHLPTAIPRAGVSVSASASASAPSLTLVNPDTHRQSHSSSKLPSFRFADRRASVGNGNGSASGNAIDADQSRDHAEDDCIIDASRPNNTGKNSPSTSAALSHPSLAYHAPPSPGAPNPGPAPAPASSPIRLPSADPGPVSGPDVGLFAGPARQAGAVTGRTFAASGSLDWEAPDSPPLPTAPNLAHPTTTHHHSEKHSSTSAPASAPAHASAFSPTAQTSTSPFSATSLPRPPSPQRALSFQPESSSSPVVEQPTQARRRTSFPDRLPVQDDVESPHPTTTTIIAHSRSRRSLVSRRSNGAVSSGCPPLSLNQDRLQAVEAVAAESTHRTSSDRSSKDSLPGQRELLLPKTLATSSPPDDRRASLSHRPPVSYRPPVNHNAQPSTSGPVRVPPIRAFRSSGSRKSLTLDMNSRSRIFDDGSDQNDSSFDRTLRDFEGGSDQDFLPLSATLSSRRDTLDGDDTGDVFLKIAREEAPKRLPDENIPDETQSVVSRVTRSHRRPLSSVVPSYNPTSPPQIRRRLSDQQETERQRHYDDERVSAVSRMSSYRTNAREKVLSIHPGEDLINRARAGGATIRAVPSTPRSMAAFQDSDNSTYSRRRGSITDNSSAGQTRVSTYRSTGAGHAQTKTYHSSPLIKSFDLPQPSTETNQAGMEGTESTGSTTAPSTVWDELDDLKSRIHRLELTGKLPPTSAAAVSRLSDERPPTATTTVTTMSSSPKRPGNGNANQATEATSTASSHREAHPLLQSALAKSKPLLDAEVFRALESAASDAMALASMMGSPGQPGPISSGASTLGGPGATITDRQLRRKADSVCRSLTELCVALGEDRTITRPQPTQAQAQTQAQQTQAQAPAQTQTQTQAQTQPQVQTTTQTLTAPARPSTDAPTTPTVNKTFSGLTQQRRQSTSAEQALASNTTSPRTMSKFEERRFSLLNGSTLGGPRTTASTPSTPLEPISRRRSSLLVSRTRRAGTEEPPEDGRRSSLLLRTRRAGTEEPDEGRRTSLLVRNRRKTFDADDDEPPSLRAPSRINTDLTMTRAGSQEPSPSTDNLALGSSALPRRRFTSHLNPSRLVTPLNSTPQRKYLERSNTQDREGSVERVLEERPQRHMSLGQSVLNRTSSMIRRPNRDSNVTITQSSATASAYR